MTRSYLLSISARLAPNKTPFEAPRSLLKVNSTRPRTRSDFKGEESSQTGLEIARRYLSRLLSIRFIEIFPPGGSGPKRRARDHEILERQYRISGPSREGSSRRGVGDDCICSEIPRDLGISGAEIARITSPEVTHTLRIAMKCHHRRSAPEDDDDEDDEGPEEADERRTEEETEVGGEEKASNDKRDLQGPSNARKEPVKHDAFRCTVAAGANAALDLTLNCNSVRLTFRDTSLKAATRGER